MKLALFFLVTVVASGYCRQMPLNDQSKSHLRVRRSDWEDVGNEVVDDVSGGADCATALETFVAENPELVVLVRRNTQSHEITKRGIGSWLSKLNPITSLYSCGTFLKNKGYQLYNVIRDATDNREKRGIFNDLQDIAEELGKVYENSLVNMIHSVGEIASHLEVTENSSDEENKFLHKAVTNVESFLKSYADKFHRGTAVDVFSTILNLLPSMDLNIQALNWDVLTTFKPEMNILDVLKLSKELSKSKLAENLLMIIDFANQLSPEFSNTLVSYGNKLIGDSFSFGAHTSLKDLSSSLICFKFLSKTSEIGEMIENQQFAKLMDMIDKMGYLNDAYTCGSHVMKHSEVFGADVERISRTLDTILRDAVENSIKYLDQLEAHLKDVEQPVKVFYEDKQLLLSAVAAVKETLQAYVIKYDPEVTETIFANVFKALEVVEKMFEDWKFEATAKDVQLVRHKGHSKLFLPFEAGSLVDNKLQTVDNDRLVSTASLAQSFINVYNYAREHNIFKLSQL